MAPTPGREDAQGGPAAEIDVPPAPILRKSELWPDRPFMLLDGTRYTLGWQSWPEGQGGPGFVTVRRSALGMQKIVNRYPLTEEGWRQAWRELTSLDPPAAERIRSVLAQRAKMADSDQHWAAEVPDPSQEAAVVGEREPWHEPSRDAKRERRQERLERARKKGVTFFSLGVRVRDGEVYPYPTFGQPALGPVEGAGAEITDPTKAQMVRAGLASGLAFGAVIGPLALAPGLLRKSKAVALVVCANGNIREKKLDGTSAIRAAQSAAVKFNALARSEDQPVTAPPQPPPATASERLAEVTRLHDEGLLTDEEFQAKRAEIISQL
jgi:hypothetical protein